MKEFVVFIFSNIPFVLLLVFLGVRMLLPLGSKIYSLTTIRGMISRLGSGDLGEREKVITVLSKKGTKAVKLLTETLHSPRRTRAIRKGAAEALGRIGDATAVKPLIDALQDKHPVIRKEAVAALAKLKDLRAITPLIQVLNDDDVIVRREIALALGNMGDPRAIDPLKKTLLDPVSRVQSEAKNALEKLGVPSSEIQSILEQQHDRPEELLNHLLSSVETGTPPSEISPEQNTLWNVELVSLPIPLPTLKQIIIAVESYDFHLVERFLTYAVNYVGQERLKEQVLVSIYGDGDALHPNLRNAFTNLCHQVEFKEI